MATGPSFPKVDNDIHWINLYQAIVCNICTPPFPPFPVLRTSVFFLPLKISNITFTPEDSPKILVFPLKNMGLLLKNVVKINKASFPEEYHIFLLYPLKKNAQFL